MVCVWLLKLEISVQMFLPIHDGVVKHWFLAVVNIPDAVCEIWDSNPVDSANTRRQEYAIASVSESSINTLQFVCFA